MKQPRFGMDPLSGFDLRQRTALVTGARREIGEAIACALAAQGATLAIHHAGTDEERQDANRVVDIIVEAGGRATTHAADFVLQGAGKRLAEDVLQTHSSIDILVLNASIEIPEAYTEVSSETFDRQIAINLRSTLDLIQALVPPMVSRGWGRVLSIGSVQQSLPHPAMLVYAGTKAAQFNWMVNLARQFSGSTVTFNNLAPGPIATARNNFLRDNEELLGRVPVGRFGRPEDIVGAALLLCSNAGAFITGTNLYVDGGRHIG